MPVKSNIPNTLAQEALATGGLRAPLKGSDVLDVDPSQLDLDALPPSEIDAISPMIEPDTELLQLASTGPVSKMFGKLLSPKTDTFNKAQQKLEQLQAESGETNNALGRMDDGSPEPALDLPPTEVDEEGFGPGFDAAQEQGYQIYERGSIIRADGKTAEAVMSGLQKKAEVSSKGLLDDFRAVGSAGDAKIPDEEGVLAKPMQGKLMRQSGVRLP